ncbi:uncharacterized protein B0H18DRAFT_1001951 [Fomitopsis serialis]|uniref:uncharacterized protein n=1 Tax=Fomitopsis serialis TaxID=139415 RepID=UPI002008C5E2|nr:uncharacterized protein B0H18DRAFT_1019288 [Neoantrodia serialis]XP_047894381.1 uncharacterized protein B0H18DRAFT_1001951 [Neoantrodia serialis]KAH9922134.1 hypothetical protein B0H18DRAFT_1019288 [Neoantrodia serialis]KAH9927738.1 hypothetical protein B0H18DRAFT_1001951 [Neoantrodia serialis]
MRLCRNTPITLNNHTFTERKPHVLAQWLPAVVVCAQVAPRLRFGRPTLSLIASEAVHDLDALSQGLGDRSRAGRRDLHSLICPVVAIPIIPVQGSRGDIGTEEFLESTVEKGLLHDPHYIAQARQALASVQVQATGLRLCSHCAPTMAQQVKAMICGLLYNIYRLHQRVVVLRADMACRCVGGRYRRSESP